MIEDYGLLQTQTKVHPWARRLPAQDPWAIQLPVPVSEIFLNFIFTAKHFEDLCSSYGHVVEFGLWEVISHFQPIGAVCKCTEVEVLNFIFTAKCCFKELR